MIHRIEIGTKAGLKDARGDGAADGIRTFLDMSVDRVQTRSVLKVYADLTPDEAETVR
ncbi:hypothetical protein HQ560_06175, partial [bacterium]|nr:hypothetical protein [bacterium]